MNKEIIAVSFTGHRYVKNYKSIDEALTEFLDKFISENKDKSLRFYTGAAKGFDQMVFFKVNRFKKKYPDVEIKNIVASPIRNFKVPNMGIIQKIADEFIVVEDIPEYKTDIFIHKFQKRNEFMVDKTTILVTYYDGRSNGGTVNCIRYAKKLNKNIINLDKELQ